MKRNEFAGRERVVNEGTAGAGGKQINKEGSVAKQSLDESVAEKEQRKKGQQGGVAMNRLDERPAALIDQITGSQSGSNPGEEIAERKAVPQPWIPEAFDAFSDERGEAEDSEGNPEVFGRIKPPKKDSQTRL